MNTVNNEHREINILTKSGTNKKLNEKNFFHNINLTYLYRMVSRSLLWTLNGYNRIKQPFWINPRLCNKTLSQLCKITGIKLFDCGYRVVGILLLLLAMQEMIPD